MIKWLWRTLFRKSYQSIYDEGKRAALCSAEVIVRAAIQMAAVSGQSVEECVRAMRGAMRD